MSTFAADLQLEEAFYLHCWRPYLEGRGIRSAFLRTGTEATCRMLQLSMDIDLVADNGEKNSTMSLKVVRALYRCIFWEVVKNEASGADGWGRYSRASRIVYAMGAFAPAPGGRQLVEAFHVYAFDPAAVRSLDPEHRGYPTRHGYTHGEDGRLLYRSAGVLVPLADFAHMDLGTIACTEPVYTVSHSRKEAITHG